MDPRPASLPTALHEVAFCGVIFLSQLLTQASLGNVLVILQIVGSALSVPDTPSGDARLTWLISAFSLTVGAFILITGRLGDVYGHKRMFVLGFLWLGLCSLLLGFAVYPRSLIYFAVFRGLQGVGSATVLPNGIALLARVYPNGPRKTVVFALFGATAPSGFVIGALFASIFAQLAWWPWAYWTLAIACVVIAALAQFAVVPKEVTAAPHPDGEVDWLGAVIGVSGIGAFIYAWNEAPVVGWGEAYVFVLLIVGIALIVLFFVVEARVRAPIMPVDIWLQPGFPGVVASIALGWSSFGIWVVYTVSMIQNFRGDTPLSTVAQFSPVCLAGLCATMTMAAVHGRVKNQYILAGALTAFCIGNILIAVCPVDSSYWSYLFVAFCATPFGMDISFPAASLIVSDAMPPHRQGVAASMINTAVNLSISFGLGIAGTAQMQENDGGADPLKGQRAASYVGIGLSGIGIVVALLFCRTPEKKAGEAETQHGDGQAKLQTDGASAEPPSASANGHETPRSATGSVESPVVARVPSPSPPAIEVV